MFEMVLNAEESLIENALSAIVKSGRTIHCTQTSKLPFRLQVRNDDELLNIRIYLWELTPFSKNQYGIQIVSIDRFKPLQSGKTLVLGWWKKAEVFVGFDVRKHLGKLGSSPSMLIREDALRKAYINGFEPCGKDNKEVAIVFRPDFFVEYATHVSAFHSFGESRPDFDVLEAVATNQLVNDQDLERVSEQRRTALRTIRQSLRDHSFSNRVLTAYSNRCAFCGVHLKLIEAAHILPVSYQGSTDETSNGIALCALHHKAYDKALVTFNQRYQIIRNESKMTNLRQIGHDGGMDRFIRELKPLINVPPAERDRPFINYVAEANQLRGWGIE